MDLSFLPLVNALLNASAAGLLFYGRLLARRGRVDAHRRVMVTAFVTSCLFLVCYLVHKAWRKAATGETYTPFNAQGWVHGLYLLILLTHTLLAMAVPVLAIVLIRLGVRGRVEAHRRLARWAWPVWMYVSLTGVVIYLMLYPFNPAPR